MIYIVNPNEKSFLENAGDRPPLGALYVATSLKNAGHKVKFFDLNHDRTEDFLVDVYKNRPGYVGFSMISSPSFEEVTRLNKLVKLNSRETLTVVGGYHPTVRPQDFKDFDFVIRGDGEEAFLDVIKGGLEDKIYVSDSDFVSHPDRGFLNPDNYDMMIGGKRASTIITSRGCPYSCVFCGNYSKKVRFRNQSH